MQSMSKGKGNAITDVADEHPPTDYIKRKGKHHALTPSRAQRRDSRAKRTDDPRVQGEVRSRDHGRRSSGHRKHRDGGG